MINYINSHKAYRINKLTNIKLPDIRSGTIITFNYDSKTNKHPYVFVLNENYLTLLHGLVIDYMSIPEWDKFVSYIFKVDTTKAKTNLTEIFEQRTSAEIKLLYESKIKHFLNSKVEQSVYRTYKRSKLNNIKLVNYIL